jgi:anti-sigma factor RsiW
MTTDSDEGHSDEALFRRWKAGALSSGELAAAIEHWSVCERCWQIAQPWSGATTEDPRAHESRDEGRETDRAIDALTNLDSDHLAFAELMAYVDRSGDPESRLTASAHLGTCPMCRREAEELRPVPEARFGRMIAIAATVAMLIGIGAYLAVSAARPPRAGAPHTGSPRVTASLPTATATAAAPAPRDPIETLDPSLRSIVSSIEADSLASWSVVASLARPQGQQRSPAGGAPSFRHDLEPSGTIVETDSPTFRWSGIDRDAAVTIQVFNDRYQLVAGSPAIRGAASWACSTKLERGATYRWQITARSGTEQTVVPRAPEPPAAFHVLDGDTMNALTAARHSGNDLDAGLLCMRAGLFEEGARRLDAFAREHPHASVTRLSQKAREIAGRAASITDVVTTRNAAQ